MENTIAVEADIFLEICLAGLDLEAWRPGGLRRGGKGLEAWRPGGLVVDLCLDLDLVWISNDFHLFSSVFHRFTSIFIGFHRFFHRFSSIFAQN